jgi:hypothetical protein
MTDFRQKDFQKLCEAYEISVQSIKNNQDLYDQLGNINKQTFFMLTPHVFDCNENVPGTLAASDIMKQKTGCQQVHTLKRRGKGKRKGKRSKSTRKGKVKKKIQKDNLSACSVCQQFHDSSDWICCDRCNECGCFKIPNCTISC